MRPTTTEVQDLKFLIASRLDVTEILDILDWTTFDLVEILDEQIEERFTEFLQAVDG